MSRPRTNCNFLEYMNPLRVVRQIFTEDLGSVDQRYFIEQALIRRCQAQQDLVIRIALGYNALAMSILPLAGKAVLVKYFVSIHAVLFVTAFLALFKSAKRAFLIWFMMPFWLMCPALINFFGAYYHIAENDVTRTILTVSTAIICSSFMLLIDPRGKVPRVFSAIFCATIGFVAFYSSAAGGVLAMVNSVAILGSLGITFLHDRTFKETVIREFKLLIQAAPAKIVRQSASSNTDVDTVFGPKRRHCVCLSTDWREYQAMSSAMPPDKLAAALGAYYDMCERLASEMFPEGNYYSDWIADELFLVIFAKDHDEEKTLVNMTLQFSTRLLAAKDAFAEVHGLPAGIDIGISSGVSLIGMMGPAGHRKATALGDVPGQARRLQSIGKHIRQREGEADRVIFGAATLLEISEAFAVEEFTLEDRKQLRNMNHDRVFYIQPNKDQKKAAV